MRGSDSAPKLPLAFSFLPSDLVVFSGKEAYLYDVGSGGGGAEGGPQKVDKRNEVA